MSNTKSIIAIPLSLSHLGSQKRWVVWKWETRLSKDPSKPALPTKPPRQAIGGRVGNYAHNNNPETWATLAEAQEAYASGNCDGIGLQLLDLKGFAAIDLDDVRDKDGNYLSWAHDLIEAAGSYAEHTPSGNGGRIIGIIPDNFSTIHTKIAHPQGGHFEVYTNLTDGRGRYITVTGDQIDPKYSDLANIEGVINGLMQLADAKSNSSKDTPKPTQIESVNSFYSLPIWVKDYVQHGGKGDRSADFQSVVNHLRPRGWTFEAALKLFQDHPNGPASKYIAGNRLENELRRSWDKAKAHDPNWPTLETGELCSDPVDLWGVFPPPDLPRGLLPSLIEEFAFVRGEQMGADPAGLAMAALCTCAVAIPDRIILKVKRFDNWIESARIWVALVGSPSTKKSPILNTATAPLRAMDARLLAKWIAACKKYDALKPEEKEGQQRPKQNRLRIEDATVEAAQQVLEGSCDGILCYQDELSGFFGAMDRYNSGKGAAADRSFWLRTYNGGEFALNRVGRGVTLIPNLSVCLLGGIQPEPIRKLAADAHDDGLLQRLFPIALKAATLGRDEPKPDISSTYAELVEALNELERPGWLGTEELKFDEEAQEIRDQCEARNLALQTTELVSPKLASHVGKFDGMFARLCIIWHCIEHVTPFVDGSKSNPDRQPPSIISGATARRVADFLYGFLLPHAVHFYGCILGLSDDHNRLTAIAGHILAHKLQKITNRDVQRGDRAMRGLKDQDIRPLLEQLSALGWLYKIDGPRPSSAPHWLVNPAVHTKFGERAQIEADRRAEAQRSISQLLGGGG